MPVQQPWLDPPSRDAKILPLRPPETVDGLVELFAAVDRVQRTLNDRRRRDGWRSVVSRRHAGGRRPIEDTDTDAVVLVILAGPRFPRWSA